MKYLIFEVFWEYLSKFLTFLREIFFGSKIITSSCDKHQKFDHGCSSFPGNKTQSADFCSFFGDLGHFQVVSLTQFLRKSSSMYVISRVVKDLFMISSSMPIMNTMQTRFLPCGMAPIKWQLWCHMTSYFMTTLYFTDQHFAPFYRLFCKIAYL